LTKKLAHITLNKDSAFEQSSKTFQNQQLKISEYDIPPTIIWIGAEKIVLDDVKHIIIFAVDGKKLLSGQINWKRSPANVKSGVSFEVL
jgi:hypothetical protein